MEELLHPEWSAEKIEQLKGHYQSILSLLGEDVEREGLLKTPERVAKAMLTLTRGYEQDPHAILLGAKFKEEYSQMVIVKDIDFFSLVEAKHMCMQMRGVEKQNAITTTSDFTGAFNQAKTREEFMNLIRHNR